MICRQGLARNSDPPVLDGRVADDAMEALEIMEQSTTHIEVLGKNLPKITCEYGVGLSGMENEETEMAARYLQH